MKYQSVKDLLIFEEGFNSGLDKAVEVINGFRRFKGAVILSELNQAILEEKKDD